MLTLPGRIRPLDMLLHPLWIELKCWDHNISCRKHRTPDSVRVTDTRAWRAHRASRNLPECETH